jgi:SAM-dependent MidA family methyltransferase
MPGARADARQSPLLPVVREHVRRHGPLPVDRYMQLCLQHPEHGYWRRAQTIGAQGDFVTAPEISQVFGELIGLWCAAAWESMRRPRPVRLVELGPGRGTLMRDALRAAGVVPQLAEALDVHLVEASPALRQAQRRQLAASRQRASWHDRVREVPPGAAIVVGNEFLDALPIRQLVRAGDGWRERVVEAAPDGGLRFAPGPPAADAPAGGAAAAGTVCELREGEEALLAELAARGPPLAALLIDYGPGEPARGDTLQAVRRHGYADPLAAPGEADLTAHVQFAGLADKARAAGFAVDGPMPQAEFLGRLGLAERTARLMAANPRRAGEIEAGAQRLVSPTGMGALFKAMALRSPGLPPLLPFG